MLRVASCCRTIGKCVALLQHECNDVQATEHLEVVTSGDLVFADGTPKAWEGVVRLAVDFYHAAARTEAGQLVSLKAVKEASCASLTGGPKGSMAAGSGAGGPTRDVPVNVTVENKCEGLSAALAGALEKALKSGQSVNLQPSTSSRK